MARLKFPLHQARLKVFMEILQFKYRLKAVKSICDIHCLYLYIVDQLWLLVAYNWKMFIQNMTKANGLLYHGSLTSLLVLSRVNIIIVFSRVHDDIYSVSKYHEYTSNILPDRCKVWLSISFNDSVNCSRLLFQRRYKMTFELSLISILRNKHSIYSNTMVNSVSLDCKISFYMEGETPLPCWLLLEMPSLSQQIYWRLLGQHDRVRNPPLSGNVL